MSDHSHSYCSLDANSPEESSRSASQARLDPPRLEVPPTIQQTNLHGHYPISPGWTLVQVAPSPPKNFFNYELPKTVTSVRDGWQWTSQSGAVVSGLLAAVAAQLLGFFKEELEEFSPAGAAGFVIAACYIALFLNIAATIGSFVLIDNLGEVGYRAAKRDAAGTLIQIETIGDYRPPISRLLKEFGATKLWNGMLYHWLFTFYLGILSLIISVLTYVILVESFATKVVMCFVVGLTLFPTTCFIFSGSFMGQKQDRAGNGEEKDQEDIPKDNIV